MGSRRSWLWLLFLVALILPGAGAYLGQLQLGLGVTGLGRDVSWGLYIAQFTFLVGVAASAVVVVLPGALHDDRAFARVTILGELLAIAAVTMCLLFILVDLGQPARALNVLLYPTPNSIMFWDMVSLGGYLVLNAVIATASLSAERHGVPPPAWLRPAVLLSIPWAVSIHTVTAFLYSGLAARPYWLTALLAPRFLVSAFASGPALLILLILVVRRVAAFDPGAQAIPRLALVVTYTTILNAFFVLLEVFTVFYSGLPDLRVHFEFLFVGLPGNRLLVPWMWASAALAVGALILLVPPRSRRREGRLAMACGMVFASLWIDKGLGLIAGGFTPSPLGEVSRYVPTSSEVAITVAIWAAGALMLTLLYTVALAIRGELAAPSTASAAGDGGASPARAA